MVDQHRHIQFYKQNMTDPKQLNEINGKISIFTVFLDSKYFINTFTNLYYINYLISQMN